MDTTQTTHISLCSGYGGIDLGLRRCIPDLRTIAYSEIEAAACELLLARMEGGQLDPAPIWTDLKSFPWRSFRGKVDILSGGYPCQPFSSAGKRAGKDDPRHLWPWIADGVAAMQPRLCFFENVEGHISLGLSTVVSDLEELGYRTTWGLFSASEVGAPHQRKRVFIMAISSSIGGATRLSGSFAGNEGQPGVAKHSSNQVWPSRPGEPQHEWEPLRVVGNAKSRKDHGRESTDLGEAAGEGRCGNDAADCAGKVVGNTESGTRFGRASRDERHAAQSNEGVGDASLLYGSGQARGQRQTQVRRAGTARYNWKTQPPLGGDADGPAGGLDYGQLCRSSDNRTDELRMLGNGVVPATAEQAFRTLMAELVG